MVNTWQWTHSGLVNKGRRFFFVIFKVGELFFIFCARGVSGLAVSFWSYSGFFHFAMESFMLTPKRLNFIQATETMSRGGGCSSWWCWRWQKEERVGGLVYMQIEQGCWLNFLLWIKENYIPKAFFFPFCAQDLKRLEACQRNTGCHRLTDLSSVQSTRGHYSGN